MNQEYVAPTEYLLDNLGPGCFVEINQGKGPFWVEINDTDGFIFGGKVHPRFSGIECPYHQEVDVLFNRSEISHLGCDRFCFC